MVSEALVRYQGCTRDSSSLMTNDNGQRSLFTASELKTFSPPGPRTQSPLEMDCDALQKWKADIFHYQEQVRQSQPVAQANLFGWAELGVDATSIDPFGLELFNFFFFNWPADRHPDNPCIYFVIDTSLPLLLYVGETCKANQRWKGVHDCKQYVLNYQSLHFKYGLPTAINTAFWWETPAETRPRQRLESDLIERWKSPFNKENWKFWRTPFISEK